MTALASLERAIEKGVDGFSAVNSGTRLLSLSTARLDHCMVRQLSECLAPEERRRAAFIHDPRRQSTFILAHACLRQALACTLRFPYMRVSYRRIRGKPVLEDGLAPLDFDFSLSHSSHAVLIGMRAGGRIGVDIERINAEHPLLRHPGRVCSDEELRASPGEGGDSAARWLFNCWARKEAYLKALGSGLPAKSLRELTLRRRPDSGWSVYSDQGAAGAAVYDAGDRAGFCAAVCVIPSIRVTATRQVLFEERHAGRDEQSVCLE